MTSAVKVDGERLYKKAHRGEVVETPVKEVEIEAIDVLDFDEAAQTMRCHIACSKGTYVRQLAIDLGEAVGAGAHLEQLSRTAVGDLLLDEAQTLAEFEEAIEEREAGDEHIPGLVPPAVGPAVHARHRALGRPGDRRAQRRPAARRPAGAGAPHLPRRAHRHLRAGRGGQRPEAARQGLMQVVSDIASLPRALGRSRWGRSTACTPGTARSSAAPSSSPSERGLTSAVVTFDRHPLSVVDPARAPRLLTSNEEKVRLIAELGPDELIMLPFDEKMAALTPAEFCAGLLAGGLEARAVVVGENFNFGAARGRRRGAAARLRRRQRLRRRGLPARHRARRADQLHAHPPAAARRRARGGAGDPRPAAVGAGVVVHGDQRGRTLGVPTANVDVEAGTIFPGRGVYAARCLVDGAWYRAAVNIGHNPTFQSRDEPTTHVTVEAFLLEFSGDIYDHEIRLDFLHKIRDERRFDTVDALVAQMRLDIEAARALADPELDAVGLGAARRLSAPATTRARFVAAARCATLTRPLSRSRVANP